MTKKIYVLLTGDYEDFTEADMGTHGYSTLEDAQKVMVTFLRKDYSAEELKKYDPNSDVEKPGSGLWYRTGDNCDCIKEVEIDVDYID